MALTQLTVERAKAPISGQRFIRDRRTPGPALRVTANGVRSFVWEGRVRGRVRRITLGQHPAMSLGLARQKAIEKATAVARGENPADALARERRELTFGRLAARYMERHARARKRSADQAERMLRDVLPPRDDAQDLEAAPIPAGWRLRRLSDVSRDDVAQLHARIGRDRGHYAASRVLALIRTVFNLAHLWGVFDDENPARGIRMFREENRDRFLSPDELNHVLEAIETEPDERWRAYFKLALLLGPRRSELLRARWEDFDLTARTWRLPTTKAGRSHLLPLPSAAVVILEALSSRTPTFAQTADSGGEREQEEMPWLFPSPTAASGHLEDPKKPWQRIRTRAGVKDVRVHDLRRTLGSWLAASGYGLPLIGRVLNHTQPSTTAVYARLDLEPVRAALEANARLMLGAVDPTS